MDYVWIGVGATLGANARYLVGQGMARWLGVDFPFGTLAVNVSGSLLIGLIMTAMSDRLLLDSHWRLLLVIGLVGGYTTFSSFSYEAIAMLQAGRAVPAFAYVSSSVISSLFACYVGIISAHVLGG